MSDDLIKRLRHDGQSDRQYLREAKTVLRAERTEAADCIEKLVRQRDGWEETALMYAQNVDFWKSKLAKAVEALMTAQEYIDDLESHEGAEGFSLSTKVLGDSYYAALAELEGDNV
jgi:hypothetical protein